MTKEIEINSACCANCRESHDIILITPNWRGTCMCNRFDNRRFLNDICRFHRFKNDYND